MFKISESLTRSEVHYEQSTKYPGGYRTGLVDAYPEVDEPILDPWGPWVPSLYVIVGGTDYGRTCAGVSLLRPAAEDGIKVYRWRENVYMENLSQLQEYRTFAQKLPGNQELIDQYYEYERRFLTVEAAPYVFFDAIGNSGLWPSDSVKLISLVETRLQAKNPTVLAISPAAFDRVPEWERFLQGPNVSVVDIGEG